MVSYKALNTTCEDKISEMEKLRVKYYEIKKAFDDIVFDHHLICHDNDCDISLPIAAIEHTVRGLISNTLSGIGEDRKLRTPDVREKVEEFISECSKQLSSILSSKYLYSPLYVKIRDRELERLSEINEVVVDKHGITEQIKTLDFDEFKQDVHISLDGMVNIEHLVPWLSTFHRHDRAMISRYLYSISDILVGKKEPTGNVTKSYLELTVIPSILNQIQSDYKKAMKERSEECSEYLKRVRTKRLSMVIKDLASFEEELEVLKSLKENLMKMK